MSNNRKGTVWAAGLLVAAGAVFLLLRRVHFDWGMFGAQLRHVRWPHILAGVALIYATYWLRAWRWAVFCSPMKKVRPRDLLPSQFVGFTAVALFGRLADLVRPYLVARRADLPLSSQIAVYTIERMFDLGAAAVVFSTALAFAPRGMEHRDRFVRVGAGSLLATLVIALFALLIRVKGDAVAVSARRLLSRVSAGAAEGAAAKILGFREGLNAIASVGEFAAAAVISLTMWGMIGMTYWQVTHGFAETPELARLSFSRTMLLMAVSLGGSLVQLPVLGWFTQIAATATAMRAFYGAPIEAATACGGLLLLVTSLSILPMGLFFSWTEGVSLRDVASESGGARTASGTVPEVFATDSTHNRDDG